MRNRRSLSCFIFSSSADEIKPSAIFTIKGKGRVFIATKFFKAWLDGKGTINKGTLNKQGKEEGNYLLQNVAVS